MSGGRLLCVGDVHGCATELERLIAAVAPGTDDTLVFLGDYVDRGPAVRETISFLSDLRQSLPETVFLRGNHEEMFLDFLGLGGANREAFLDNGGAETLASYGVKAIERASAGDTALTALPAEHLDFLAGLVLQHESDGYAFVHAGIRPGVPFAEQRREDLLWIREEFLVLDHGLESTVVFGHTPHREVWFGGGRGTRKIGLDTGCVYGGRLSCIDLTDGVLHQIVLGARATTRQSVTMQLAEVC